MLDLTQNHLINGDCLQELTQVSDASIDFICTDLPFGVLNKRTAWDSIIPMDQLWAQYLRIIKPKGVIALNAMQPFTSLLVTSNMDNFRYELIWEKEAGTGFLNAKKQPLRNHESILIFYKEAGGIYNPQMRTGFKPYKIQSGEASLNYGEQKSVITESTGDRYPVSILKFARDKEKLHSTQKPVALCEWLVNTYSNVGDIVLDSTMGSGTTCLAALRLNRRFVGIEKDEAIFAIATKRLSLEQEIQKNVL